MKNRHKPTWDVGHCVGALAIVECLHVYTVNYRNEPTWDVGHCVGVSAHVEKSPHENRENPSKANTGYEPLRGRFRTW